MYSDPSAAPCLALLPLERPPKYFHTRYGKRPKSRGPASPRVHPQDLDYMTPCTLNSIAKHHNRFQLQEKLLKRL